ncbi:endoribonuclease L-PSP [Pelagophyceae sp. CCMP2097]|nr:endoribonuclease L-PSP [Pelagophyceae sp. CCMP2097]
MASMGSPVAVEPGKRMSNAVVHGGLVYTAGTTCDVEPETKDVRQQTLDALEELDRVLALCGSDKDHIISMQVWITDMAKFAEMNAVYDAWVSQKCPPGRACVEAGLASPYKVEFKCIAAQKPKTN